MFPLGNSLPNFSSIYSYMPFLFKVLAISIHNYHMTLYHVITFHNLFSNSFDINHDPINESEEKNRNRITTLIAKLGKNPRRSMVIKTRVILPLYVVCIYKSSLQVRREKGLLLPSGRKRANEMSGQVKRQDIPAYGGPLSQVPQTTLHAA